MVEHFIYHEGKEYPVMEPTIKIWKEVMKLKNILDEAELFIKMLELTTGLSKEDILRADASEIRETGEKILQVFSRANKQVTKDFFHEGVEYEFLDIHNLSFGQFIDIDTFLGKDETYRIQNLNELAAYLYTEKGTKYGEKSIKKRQEIFDTLPMKYMEGSVFFLLSTAKISDALIQICSQSKLLRTTAIMKIHLHLTGVGIKQSARSVRTKYGYLMMLLTYPLFSASIIFRTLWTLIRKKKG